MHNTVVTPGKAALRIIRPPGGLFSGSITVGNNAFYGTPAIRADSGSSASDLS